MKKINLFITLLLTALLCLPWNGVMADELTVADGSSTTLYAPLYGYYGDEYIRTQIIYPAESAMNGTDITSMTFYMSTKGSKALTSEFQIRLCEVEDATFSNTSWKDVSGATLVYEGTLDCNTTTTMTITFQNAYSYKGGNLLFDLQSKTKGTYTSNSSPNFVAENINGATYNFLYSHNATSIASMTTGTAGYKLPKVMFTYEAAATCPKPKALTKGAVTSTSATFSWTAGGEENTWQWVCLPKASAVDWTDAGVQTTTSATATATGLDANTEYTFYVRAYCNADDQSSEISKAFTTPCAGYATADLPFEEDFNTTSTSGYVLPSCWSRGNGNYPYTYGSSGVDNSKCMRFYGGISGTSEQIAILPPFEAQINTLVISLVYKHTSTTTYAGKIKLGYITDPSDATTFQALKELPRTTEWNYTEVNKFALSAAPDNSYIALLYSGGTSSAGTVYIDNIKVAIPSSCTDPSEVNAAAASATSATVSWIENGSADKWNIQYSTDNFATHTDVNGVTENPYTLPGLTANTTYKVRVQVDCGSEQSDWVVSNQFTTPCEAVEGIGYSTGFESPAYTYSYALPDCWQKIASGNYPYIYNYYQRTGSQGLYFGGGVTGTSEQIAILPPFSENTSSLSISLYYNNASNWDDYNGADYGQLSVGYITNPADASTFTVVASLAKVNTYTLAKVPMIDAPENAYIAIRYAGGTSTGYAFVDDLEISEVSSCLEPSGAAGTVLSHNSASISWRENGSADKWKIRYSSDNGISWSEDIEPTTKSFELTGLEGNTEYIVQVKSICSEEESSDWSVSSAPFKTPCTPVDASDYSETFESATVGSGKLPDCWSYKQSATLYSTTYPMVYGYNAYAYQGNNSLYFYGGTGSSEQTILLPVMDRALNELTIEFYYNAQESQYSTLAQLEIDYIAADGTTYNTVEVLDYAAAYTKYTKALSSVPADAANIAIRYAGGELNGTACIDNVRVYPTPSCATPTAVAAANFTANSAVISWTANAGESAWNVQYSTDGTNWTDANEGNAVEGNPYTLTGLAANTLYYARVRAVCSASDESPWSEASAAFRTNCGAITVDAEHDWVEGFESNAIGNSSSAAPHCWALLNANEGDYPYIFVNSGTYAHNSDRALFFNNKHLVESFAIFPEFTNELSTLQISFWHKEENRVKSGYLELGYLTDIDDASSFTLLQQFERDNNYKFEEVNLAPVPTGARLAFRYISVDETWEYYTVVDDITISLTPPCPHPRKVTAVALSATKATIAWTEFGSADTWQIRYSTDDKETWSSEVTATVNPFTLEGLDPSTTYDVQVRAYCSESEQSVWELADDYFTTDCDSKTIGWKESFDSENAVPYCWNNSIHTGDNYWDVDNYYEYHSASYSARYNGRTATSNSADLITPSVNLDNNAMLVFWYRNAVTAEVYVKDGSTTTQLLSIPAQTNWTEARIDLSDYKGKEVSFIFRAHGAGTSATKYIYLDDVSVVPFLKDNEDNSEALAAYNGKKVDVVIGRSIACEEYFNTLCLPFSLPTLNNTPLQGGELWAFKYAKVDEATGELLFRIVEATSIEAGVPYFIAFPAGEPIVNPLFKNVTISATSGKSAGNEVAQLWGIVDKPEVFEPNDETKLFLAANNTLYWWQGDANSQLNNFRAFFQVNTGSSHAPVYHGMPARIIKEEETATGVDQVTNGQVQSIKLLENNQVVIIRNGVKYNVQGQVIERLQ